jgi:hypothetical protein
MSVLPDGRYLPNGQEVTGTAPLIVVNESPVIGSFVAARERLDDDDDGESFKWRCCINFSLWSFCVGPVKEADRSVAITLYKALNCFTRNIHLYHTKDREDED